MTGPLAITEGAFQEKTRQPIAILATPLVSQSGYAHGVRLQSCAIGQKLMALSMIFRADQPVKKSTSPASQVLAILADWTLAALSIEVRQHL